MDLLLFLLLAAGSACVRATGGYSGAQVLKVQTDQEPSLDQLLHQPGIDVWSGNGSHLDVLVHRELLSDFKDTLTRRQVPFRVMIPDVEEVIQEENQRATGAARNNMNATGYRMNWSQYQRLDVILEFLQELAKRNPQFVALGVMGRSTEGRPLAYVKISSGKLNAKAVFIDGGIHAREWISPASVTWIIRELVENRNQLPQELKDLDFYILPVINPDGYEFSHTTSRLWRKNRSGEEGSCRGTDLNRNFDVPQFGGEGTSDDPCSEVYRGKSPASEPETKAFQTFLTGLRDNLKAYITVHSYGQFILIPYSYKINAFGPHFEEMNQIGVAAADAIERTSSINYSVGNSANVLYPAAGVAIDWVTDNIGVSYAYCIELRDTGDHGFLLPARQIIPTAREAFEAVKVIASAAAQ